MKKDIQNGQSRAMILILCFAFLMSCTPSTSKYESATLNYVDLSDSAKITAQPVISAPITLQALKISDSIIVIDVDSIVNSNLRGFGGAFNEQGGEAFMSLSETERKKVAEALFNPFKGSGFSLCRTAVGSSDFGLSAYSYSETAEDYEMKDFSIARDTSSVIPFIRAAMAENPDLKVFASPWSPPGWMKVSGKMDGGDVNVADNILRANPEIFNAYALYFSKYVQEYAKNGVGIDRLIVQNEPDMNPKYPGCDMSMEQMAELITNYIKPQFKKDGISAEVWAGSFRNHRSDAQSFMKLENAGDAVGVGLQYCEPIVMRHLHKNYLGVRMMHTEGVCFDGDNSMQEARSRFGEIASYINLGVENYCYWNIALNETSTSGWGWKQNSLIKIDRNAGEVTYNPDYAPVSLLSRYIRPGDQSVSVNTPEGETVMAVVNDQRLVVFLQNDETVIKTKNLELEGELYAAEIPAQSLCALVFEKNNKTSKNE